VDTKKIITQLEKPDTLWVPEYLSRCGRLALLKLISIVAPRIADMSRMIGVASK
jgi:hypothetical protein